MVERRVCTFCGKEIEPGTGRMYVKKDGVTYQLCASKCFKNMVELKRIPRRTEWTTWHAREKKVRLKAAEPEPEAKRARKVRKKSRDESGETGADSAGNEEGGPPKEPAQGDE